MAAIGWIYRAQSDPIFLASETVPPFIVAPKSHQPVDTLMVFKAAFVDMAMEDISVLMHRNRTIVIERTRRRLTDCKCPSENILNPLSHL